MPYGVRTNESEMTNENRMDFHHCDADTFNNKELCMTYASEEETKALIVPDTRSPAEKKLDKMLDKRGAWEMGADPYGVLYKIAIELLEKK